MKFLLLLLFSLSFVACYNDRVCIAPPSGTCQNYVTTGYPPNLPRYGPNAYWNIPVCQLGKWSRSDDYRDRFWYYSTQGFALFGNMNVNFGAATPTDVGDFSRPVYDSSLATSTRMIRILSWGTGTNVVPPATIPWSNLYLPSTGSDGMLNIINPSTGQELGIWAYNSDPTYQQLNCPGINLATEICVGACNILETNPGNYINYHTFEGNCGGEGISNGMPGLLGVSADEVAAGEIRHALNTAFWTSMTGPPCSDADMQYSNISGVTCGYALSPSGQFEKISQTILTNCQTSHPYNDTFRDITIPEGMRMALNVDDNYIEDWLFKTGFTGAKKNTARIFARALKDYGVIFTDTSCFSSAIYTEGNWNQTAKALWKSLGIDPETDSNVGHLLDGLFQREKLWIVAPPMENRPFTVPYRWWKTIQNGFIYNTTNANDCNDPIPAGGCLGYPPVVAPKTPGNCLPVTGNGETCTLGCKESMTIGFTGDMSATCNNGVWTIGTGHCIANNSVCGDGIVSGTEFCDTLNNPCCSSDCTKLIANAVCGAGSGPCCDVSTCQYKAAGTKCNNETYCTNMAMCNGASSTCPSSVQKTIGTPCGFGNVAFAGGGCDGLGNCRSNYLACYTIDTGSTSCSLGPSYDAQCANLYCSSFWTGGNCQSYSSLTNFGTRPNGVLCGSTTVPRGYCYNGACMNATYQLGCTTPTPTAIVSNAASGTCTAPWYNNSATCFLGCASGYKMLGYLNILCTNSVWQAPRGSCVPVSGSNNPCGAPAVTAGHTVGNCGSSTNSGGSCTLGCDTTHTVGSTGSNAITCTNGVWSAPTAICNPNCASLFTLPANSGAGTCTANYASGGTCAVTCNSGYYLASGSLSASCSTSGSWTTPTAVCSPSPCATTPTLGAGQTAGSCTAGSPSGANCALTCDSTHTASGSLALVCTNGNWNTPTAGVCNPNCATLPSIPANANQGNCATNFASGSSCTLSCNGGFNAAGSLTATCTTSGSWTAVSGSCVSGTGNPCNSQPASLPAGFGTAACTIPSNDGSSCTLACDSTHTASGSLQITCNNGGWTNPSGTCDVNCAAIPTLANAGAGTCSTNYPSGSSCSLTCNAGYAASGSLIASCSSGSWSTISGSCVAGSTCNTQPTSLGTGFATPTCTTPASSGSSTCTLHCDSSHTASSTGSFIVTCNNGAWSSPTGNCDQSSGSSGGKKGASATKNNNNSAIIGGVVGGVLGGALIIGLVWVYRRSRGDTGAKRTENPLTEMSY